MSISVLLFSCDQLVHSNLSLLLCFLGLVFITVNPMQYCIAGYGNFTYFIFQKVKAMATSQRLMSPASGLLCSIAGSTDLRDLWTSFMMWATSQ